jgi:hypothetical protein
MWLRDPLPFFKKFPDADLLTSTDHLTPTIGGAETLERYPDAGSAFNIGARACACACVCVCGTQATGVPCTHAHASKAACKQPIWCMCA